MTKAICDARLISATDGDVLPGVASCARKVKAGHDYAVAVQMDSGELNGDYAEWAWQTNRNQINRQVFYFIFDGTSGLCTTQFMPIKTCFTDSG